MEFSAIKAEVESWLLTLPAGATARVGGWVNEAIRDACQRYNFKFMEANHSAISTTQQRVLDAKPALWKAPREKPLILNQDGSTTEFDWATEADMRRVYAVQLPSETSTAAPDEGQPRYLVAGVDNLELYPLPDELSGWTNGLYRVETPYWAYLADLAADNDTNKLTEDAPYYCIWKAVELGLKWNRDFDAALRFAADAEKKFREYERKDKLAGLPNRLSLTPHRDVYGGRSRSGNRG